MWYWLPWIWVSNDATSFCAFCFSSLNLCKTGGLVHFRGERGGLEGFEWSGGIGPVSETQDLQIKMHGKSGVKSKCPWLLSNSVRVQADSFVEVFFFIRHTTKTFVCVCAGCTCRPISDIFFYYFLPYFETASFTKPRAHLFGFTRWLGSSENLPGFPCLALGFKMCVV